MTTSTIVPTAGRPVRLVTGGLARTHRLQSLTFAVVIVVGVAIITAAMEVFGRVELSFWSIVTASAMKFWMLSIGVMITSGSLRLFVAHGITRRDFTTGAALVGVVIAATAALFVVAGFGAERLVYDAAGWLPQLDDPYPVGSVGDAATEWLTSLLVYVTYLAVGWLIGSLFYRYGPWLGIVLTAPALAPAALTEFALGTGWLDRSDDSGLPYPGAAAIAVVGIAVTFAVLRLILRDVPIRRPAR